MISEIKFNIRRKRSYAVMDRTSNFFKNVNIKRSGTITVVPSGISTICEGFGGGECRQLEDT